MRPSNHKVQAEIIHHPARRIAFCVLSNGLAAINFLPVHFECIKWPQSTWHLSYCSNAQILANYLNWTKHVWHLTVDRLNNNISLWYFNIPFMLSCTLVTMIMMMIMVMGHLSGNAVKCSVARIIRWLRRRLVLYLKRLYTINKIAVCSVRAIVFQGAQRKRTSWKYHCTLCFLYSLLRRELLFSMCSFNVIK